MPDLSPATPHEIAQALAFALQYDGRRRVHQADSFMARIAAERLVQHDPPKAIRRLCLREHIADANPVSLKSMGFPENWWDRRPWLEGRP